MQIYLLIILTIETVIIVFLVFSFIKKSKSLSELIYKVSSLRYEEKKLEDVQQEREDYLAMLVHDLRSPLSVIKGAADLVIKEASNLNQEDIFKILSQIKKSSEGLLKIVNDILDISKIEAGKFDLKKQKDQINKVLDEEYQSFTPLIKEHNMRITTHFDSSIPVFMFDPDRIKQVLNNLLSNALKFSSIGGEITISSKNVGKGVEVEISDQGIGIPDHMKPKLFHKFVQVHHHDDDQEDQKGSGLGLVISKEIVEAHGGKIWIEDNKPQGSKFIFSLPY